MLSYTISTLTLVFIRKNVLSILLKGYTLLKLQFKMLKLVLKLLVPYIVIDYKELSIRNLVREILSNKISVLAFVAIISIN